MDLIKNMAEIKHRLSIEERGKVNNNLNSYISQLPIIEDSFQQIKQPNEMTEILKELFDVSKVSMISELSDDEIKLATRIYVIAEMKNIPAWKSGLDMFLKLKLSNKRKSRKELLEAISGYYSQRNRGFFSRLFNRQDPNRMMM